MVTSYRFGLLDAECGAVAVVFVAVVMFFGRVFVEWRDIKRVLYRAFRSTKAS